jgi:DnaJ-class molecular chaperone
MAYKDYYETLGVSETATGDEIKKSYRKLAFQYHPDKNAGNEEMMKLINEAYAVLSESGKRKEYDSYRHRYGSFAREQFRQSYTEKDIFRDSDINHIFEELSRAFGLSKPEDIFSRTSFYGTQYRTFEFKGPAFFGSGFFSFGPKRGYPNEKPGRRHSEPTNVTKGENFFTKILYWGLGALQNNRARKYGLGITDGAGTFRDELRITPEEARRGGKVSYHYRMRGKPRDLLVSIPPGMEEGQKIRLKGMGERGKNGGASGDLYLTVRIGNDFLKRIKKHLRI